VLASYPRSAAQAFASFLAESGVEIAGICWLSAGSGPEASRFGDRRFIDAASTLEVGADSALLVPDTAVPSMNLITPLEERLGRPVLTANQVSLWKACMLAGIPARAAGMGQLFA
jgi:maleate isomerase